jgi:hypothetical protein
MIGSDHAWPVITNTECFGAGVRRDCAMSSPVVGGDLVRAGRQGYGRRIGVGGGRADVSEADPGTGQDEHPPRPAGVGPFN